MAAAPVISQRHPAEADLLQRALAGQPAAIDSVLNQLASANRWLQQIMLETIEDNAERALWQRLLVCLALHGWGGTEDDRLRRDREAAERIDAALVRLFVAEAETAAAAVIPAVLRQALSDEECRVRSHAAALLGLRGDGQGLEVLVQAVRTGEPDCQRLAVTALGKLKDERGGWALVEALAGDDEALHWEASRALDDLGLKALPALLDALKSAKPHVRWHAVRALGGLDNRAAVSALAEALGDSDYSVRWAAADALTGIGLPAVPAILDRLSRYAPMDDLYQAAYHALYRMGPGPAQTRLKPLLQALRGPAAPVEAAMVAYRLLQEWTPAQ